LVWSGIFDFRHSTIQKGLETQKSQNRFRDFMRKVGLRIKSVAYKWKALLSQIFSRFALQIF